MHVVQKGNNCKAKFLDDEEYRVYQADAEKSLEIYPVAGRHRKCKEFLNKR